jgi:hypothetical protein
VGNRTKSGYLLEPVCQMCAGSDIYLRKCPDISSGASPSILLGATVLGLMLRRKIAGRVLKTRICQPPIYGRVDNGFRCNPSMASHIHSKLLLPYSRRSLPGYNLRPQFCDPPGTAKGTHADF